MPTTRLRKPGQAAMVWHVPVPSNTRSVASSNALSSSPVIYGTRHAHFWSLVACSRTVQSEEGSCGIYRKLPAYGWKKEWESLACLSLNIQSVLNGGPVMPNRRH